MIALRRAILMKANPVVSLHAQALVQRSGMLMQKRPLLVFGPSITGKIGIREAIT